MNLSWLNNKHYSYFDNYQKSMGASLGSISYCVNLLDKFWPISTLDAGSGFSFLAFHSVHNNLTTNNDASDWSQKTSEILNSGLKKNIVIRPITKILDRKLDFVFYDYGDNKTRIYYY